MLGRSRIPNVAREGPCGGQVDGQFECHELGEHLVAFVLEDRLMFSAVPLDGLGLADILDVADGGDTNALQMDAAHHDAEQLHAPDSNAWPFDGAEFAPLSSDDDTAAAQTQADADPPPQVDAIVFVDSEAQDHVTLMADLGLADEDRNDTRVVMLSPDADGLSQISEVLADLDDIDSVHILSHGREGAVRLGDTWLDQQAVNAAAEQIAKWGEALSEGGDLLLYGCDLAADSQGKSLVRSISALTGADVAASTDATGHQSLGGDWELEFSTGVIESTLSAGPHAPQQWVGLMDAGNGDIRLHYAAGSEDGLRFRAYNDTTGLWTSEYLSANAGNTVQWVESAISADGNTELVAVLSDNGTSTRLDLLRFDGTNWTTDWSATGITSANADMRGFDLAFEGTSGDAMVVYSNNTATPVYRTWDGSAWSGELSVVGSTVTTGVVEWVELAGRGGSDELALAYSDANDDLVALRWSGSAWQETATEILLETSLGYSASDYRSFDLAFEDSGDLIVAWAYDDAGGNRIGSRSLAAGSSAWSSQLDVYLYGGLAEFVDISPEPGGDRIALVAVDENVGVERVGVATWDGSSWQDAVEIDTTIPHLETDGHGEFWAGVAFVGTSGEAVMVYSDSDAGNINYATWTAGAGWVLQGDAAFANAGLLRSVQVESFADQDKALAVFSDENGGLFAATFDGTSWSATNNGDTLESNLSDNKLRPFSMSVIPTAQPPAIDLDADNSSGATGSDYHASFTEDGGAVPISDVDATLTDIDTANLTSLLVTIANRLDGTAETLSANTAGTSITANYDGGTGVLSLSGSDTVANYQQVLRTVTYNNTSQDPVTTNRSITFVANDGLSASAAATATVSISASNNAPVLGNNGLSIGEGQTVILNAGDISAGDVDDADSGLAFTVSGFTHGQFELTTNPGVAITAFTQAQVTAGVVQFVHDGSNNAPAYNITVSDGAASVGPTAASITFTPSNNAPVLGNNSLTLSEGESVLLSGSDLSATDSDDPDSGLMFTVSGVSGGRFERVSSPGVPITSFSQAEVTSRNIRFVHDGTETTPSYSVAVSDGSSSDGPHAAAVAYTSVNDPPVNGVPAAQTTNEDTALVFSTANGNPLSVSDVEGDNATIELSVANGRLTLAQTAGLSFLAGSDGSASMTFSGTLANVNAALDGLQFDPNQNYHGPDALSMTTWDAASYNLDNDANLLGHYVFDLADPGNDSSPAGANDGTVNGAATAHDPGRGSQVLMFDGDDNVRIDGTFGSPSNITVSGWINLDAGHSNDEIIGLGQGVGLRLNDTNTGNGVTGFFYNGTAWLHTDTSQFIDGTGWRHVAYTFDDTNNVQAIFLDGAPIATTNYTESIAWWGSDTYIGSHGMGASYFLHGSVDDVRVFDRALSASEIADLAAASPDPLDFDSVAITVDPVNDAPTIDLDADDSSGATGADFDTTYTFGGAAVSLAEADAALGDVDNTIQTLTVQIDNLQDGVDEVLGHSAPATVNASYTPATGTLFFSNGGAATNADFLTALQSVTYENIASTPTTTTRAITMVANDGTVDSATATASVSFAGDAFPPTEVINTGSTAAEGAADTITVSELSFSDAVGPANITYNLTGGPANGQLERSTNPGVAVSSFTQADIDAGQLRYVHDGSETIGDSFDFDVTDGLGNTLSGQTFSLTITAGNDPPVNSVPTGTLNATEDTPLVISGTSISVSDADAGGNEVRVTLAGNNGTVTLAQIAGLTLTTGSGTDDPTVTFRGTLASVNAALDGLTFDPTPGYSGAASIQMTTNDLGFWGTGGAQIDSDTINISVGAVNDAPVLGNNLLNVSEAGSVVLSSTELSATDVDDVDSALVFTVSRVVGGQFELVTNPGVPVTSFSQTEVSLNNVRFVHDGSETAPSYSVTVSDGSAAAGPTPATVTYSPVNDAPSVNLDADDSSGAGGNDFRTVFNEDGGPVVIADIDAAMSDVDSAQLQSLTVTLTNRPDGVRESLLANTAGTAISASYNSVTGALTLSGADSVANYQQVLRTVSYDNASQNPTTADRIVTFQANDGGAYSTVATATVAVNATNDAPIASDDAFVVAEGGALASAAPGVLGNDTDIDSGSLSATLLTGPGRASSFALHPDGSFSYQHDGSDSLGDAFTYRVSDGSGGFGVATVHITVTPQNDAPQVTLGGGSVVFTENGLPVVVDSTGTVVDSDSTDFSGGTLTVDFASGGTINDRLSIRHEGPGVGQIGVAGNTLLFGGTAIGTFTGGSSGSSPLVISLNGNADALAVQSLVRNVTYENISESPDQSTRTVRMVLSDGDGGTSAAATRGAEVTAVNDAPVVSQPATDATAEDTVRTFSTANGNAVSVTDVDAGGQPVIATLSATDGTLSLAGTTGLTFSNGDGTSDATMTFAGTVAEINTALDGMTFTPSANFNRKATVSLLVDDQGNAGSGGALSHSRTTVIDISAVNDAPVATDDSYTTSEDSPLAALASGVLANDTDIDGDALSATLVSGTAHGNVVLNPDGSFVYTPDANYFGTDSFSYRVEDGSAASNAATVFLTVAPVNDAPVALGEAFAVDNDKVLSVTAPGVLENDTDVEGDVLTVELVAAPEHGTLTLLPNGQFVYEPDINFSGDEAFAYRVTDGTDVSNTVNVTIDVEAAAGPGSGGKTSSLPTVAEEQEDDSDDSDEEEVVLPPLRTHQTGEPDGSHQNPVRRSGIHGSGQQESPSLVPPGVRLQASPALRAHHVPRFDQPADSEDGAETASVVAAAQFIADDLLYGLAEGGLWKGLDKLEKELDSQFSFGVLTAGTATVASAALSVGYIAWTLRGGYLLASVLSALPAWRLIDPLPVLDALADGRPGNGKDEESLVGLLESHAKARSPNSGQPHAAESIEPVKA